MNFGRLQAIYTACDMTSILDVKVGQMLEIHEEIGEGDNKRLWKFKGLVIKIKNPGHPNGTFTIRGTSSGVVVEKIYPLGYTRFKKVILLDEYKTRKASLYWIREKVGKAARMKSKITSERRNSDLIKSS